MYKFGFQYPNEADSLFFLPLAPESFKTNIGSKNQTVDLIQLGEVNVIKGIPLREFEFKILLPADDGLCEDKNDFHEPIFYLNKFREFKLEKKVIRFIIIRFLPWGGTLFAGDIKVSLEEYEVLENAGEEGCFYVSLRFKEFKEIEVFITSSTGQLSAEGKALVTQQKQREAKESAKSYTIKKGDSLWRIAKLELNDGSRYKEIARLNGITDFRHLAIGTDIRLP